MADRMRLDIGYWIQRPKQWKIFLRYLYRGKWWKELWRDNTRWFRRGEKG